MTIKAVTLDFHNTLATCDRWFELEVRELVPAVLQHLADLGHLAAEPDAAERARVAYRTLRDSIIASGEERDALACALHTLDAVAIAAPHIGVAEAITALMQQALAEVAPQPGAIDAVLALRARGLRCGVVSSAIHHPFVEWTLERFGLRDTFGTITTSASCGYYKSRPEIYAAALRDLGVAPTEAVHVGDSYRFDVLGARSAGMRTIWYASTEEAMAQPANEADATIADLASLPTVIATLARTDASARRRRWWR